jgi:hypothetical protein
MVVSVGSYSHEPPPSLFIMYQLVYLSPFDALVTTCR